jgi:hypothetical protein
MGFYAGRFPMLSRWFIDGEGRRIADMRPSVSLRARIPGLLAAVAWLPAMFLFLPEARAASGDNAWRDTPLQPVPLVEDIVLWPPDNRLEGCVLPAGAAPERLFQNLQPSPAIPLSQAGEGSFGTLSKSCAGLEVRLIHAGQVVAQTRTDAWGRFSVANLRGGVYQVLAGSQVIQSERFCRLWTAKAAPPSARSALALPLADPVVRGQLTIPAITFPQAALFTGIVAGAVAPPIIYGKAQHDNRVPTSP